MKKPIRIAVLLVALVTSLFVFAACKTGSGKEKLTLTASIIFTKTAR